MDFAATRLSLTLRLHRTQKLTLTEIILKVQLEVSVDADLISTSKSSARCDRVVLVSYSLSRLSDSFTTQDFNFFLVFHELKQENESKHHK